jgi:hypothetical protein
MLSHRLSDQSVMQSGICNPEHSSEHRTHCKRTNLVEETASNLDSRHSLHAEANREMELWLPAFHHSGPPNHQNIVKDIDRLKLLLTVDMG